MNVDKFGHHVHKRLRVSEYFDSIDNALIKTNLGLYDLKQCRLRGLPFPVDDDEAVNKLFVDSVLKQYYSKKDIDIKVKDIIDNYLKQFLDKLNKALSVTYYNKAEIDRKFVKRNE